MTGRPTAASSFARGSLGLLERVTPDLWPGRLSESPSGWLPFGIEVHQRACQIVLIERQAPTEVTGGLISGARGRA